MKKILLNLALLIVTLVTFTGCELFGLDIQKPYDFDSEKGKYDNRISMNAWEFMNSRPDIFSNLISGINYAGIDKAVFEQADRTYLLLTNQAISSTNSSDRSFFYENPYPDPSNPLINITPTSWEEFPKDVARDMILYHVIKKALSYYELTDLTKGAITFFPTENTKEYGYVAVEMLKEGALSIYFNNYPSHYQVKAKPRTSNLQCPNGSYIHVMDKHLKYPSEDEFINIPIYK